MEAFPYISVSELDSQWFRKCTSFTRSMTIMENIKWLTIMQPSIRMFTCSYSHTWIRERCSIISTRVNVMGHVENLQNSLSGDHTILTFCRYLKMRFWRRESRNSNYYVENRALHHSVTWEFKAKGWVVYSSIRKNKISQGIYMTIRKTPLVFFIFNSYTMSYPMMNVCCLIIMDPLQTE